MSLLTFFAPSSKTSLHPGPAPFDAVLPTATLAPPSHSLHAHCQPWTMTQTMIFTFFICLRKVFLPFFAPLLLFYSPPPSFCLSFSTPPCFFACVNLPWNWSWSWATNAGCCARLGIYKNEIKKANSYQSDHGFIALIIERGTMWGGVAGLGGVGCGSCAEIAKTKM